MNYLGIDIGGTNIKFGVVSDTFEILKTVTVPTAKASYETILEQVVATAKELQKSVPFAAVGVGVPAPVKSDGTLAVCVNIPLFGHNFLQDLTDGIGLPVKMENDASCAALAEYYIGAGKGYHNVVLLTLGTGVGSGMVIDGKPYAGSDGYFEMGHMIIHANGLPCTCGRKGCFEQYASATALQRETLQASKKNPSSILAECVNEQSPCIAVFEAQKRGCPVADGVLNCYFDEVALGVSNVRWILSPDIIILGGGIVAQGDALLKPIIERVDKDVPVALASVRNQAGLLGAAMLCFNQKD